MSATLRRKVALALLPACAAFAVNLLAGTAQAATSTLEGYGAGTTGGAGGTTTTVSSLSTFTAAVKGDAAKTVRVSGTISLSGQVKVGSNTTVVGVGAASGFTGGGLELDGVHNVILQDLRISKAVGTDAITIIRGANHVWVDHDDLSSDLSHGKDYYDGLVDITHAADYITLSWNHFHDHYKVSLVGHSDSNAAEDTGHLHVTYAHNWFSNVNSRLPSVRFGTAHVYDNYFQNVSDSAVHSRMNAQTLVQNNVFRDTKTAVTTTGDSKVDGYANLSGNDLGGGATDITRTGSFTTPPYSFTLTPTSSVVSSVTAGAGTGVVG
ncbi:pectate lyase family protein [Kutzneria sp. CA-103260]|uniref:pectate lyase family protein n=1 Tax=Kutzneria sp. CA-103260 TaxID=2802641 RepID=UPI001BABB41E|nr:polysaccharide lyase family 1 protein [Kutzneria sp. CA-103260]QUQ64280.1 Pectate trisaccharide-lyase [Kutzneria sp. CA-103260]